MKIFFSIMLLFVSFTPLNAQVRQSENLVPITLKWKYKTAGKLFSSPTVAGTKVYIGGEDHFLYAIDAVTGKKAWSFKTNGAVSSTPAVFKNIVFISSFDGNLYALNANTGKMKWKFATEGEKKLGLNGLWGMKPADLYMEDQYDLFMSSPAINQKDGLVYFGSSDGYLYALDAGNGKLQWKFKTEGIIRASPVLNDGKVYIGSWDTHIYAIDQKTGKLIWKYKTGTDPNHLMEGIQSSAVVKDGKVYVGSRDGFFYALNAENGELLWKYDGQGSWIVSTAIVKDNVVYLTTSDSYLFAALDATTGKEKYRFKTSGYNFSSPLVIGDKAFFGDFSGKLYGLDLESGKLNSEFETPARVTGKGQILDGEGKLDFMFSAGKSDPVLYQTAKEVMNKFYELGPIVSSPAVLSKVIYFGSADGYLYAVNVQ